MSIEANAQALAQTRIEADRLRSKRSVLALIADAWDRLHAGTCVAGKGATRVEQVKGLDAGELASRFFAPVERDELGRWLYRPDATQVLSL